MTLKMGKYDILYDPLKKLSKLILENKERFGIYKYLLRNMIKCYLTLDISKFCLLSVNKCFNFEKLRSTSIDVSGANFIHCA